MVRIRVERTIAAAPDRVFDWLADPVHLATAPLILKAGYRKDSLPPGVGALREVIAAGMWLREEITAFDAPRSYAYRIVRSFPPTDHEGGTVECIPSGDGTRVLWLTGFTHPAYAGGKVLEAITGPAIRSGFVAILGQCAKELES